MSARWPRANVAWRIASAEVQRNGRRYIGSRHHEALLVLALVLLAPVFVVFVQAAMAVGRSLAAGDPTTVSAARYYLPGVVVFVVVLGAIQAGRRVLSLDAREMMLTAVPVRTLVRGLLLADLFEWTVVFLTPATILVLAVAVGAGSPILAVAGTLAVATLFVAAILFGYALGLLVRLGLRRVPLPTSVRSVLGALGGVTAAVMAGGLVAFAGSIAVHGPAPTATTGTGAGGVLAQVSIPVATLPAGDPLSRLSWYADLLFVGTPAVETLTTATLVAAVAVVLTIPGSLTVISVFSPSFWYGDAPLSSDGRTHIGSQSVRSPSPTRRVATRLWWRAVRSPHRHGYVFYYLFAVGTLLVPVVVYPSLALTLVGTSFVLLGVWLAGALFGLNPLGEEEEMLAQLLLATMPAAVLLRARMMLGVLVGVPLVLVGTTLLALGPLAPLDALAVGGYWVALTLASAAFALGVGTLAPRYTPVRLFARVESVAPSVTAIVYHLVATTVLVAAGPALVLAEFDLLLVVGFLFGLLVLVTDGSYRYALESFEAVGRDPGRVRWSRRLAVHLAVGVAVIGTLVSSAVGLAALVVLPGDGVTDLVLLFVAGYFGYLLVVVLILEGFGDGIRGMDVYWLSDSDVTHVIAGVAATGAVEMGVVAMAWYFDLPVAEHTLVSYAALGGAGLLLSVLPLVLLVNGPIEELMFRGVIQRNLDRSFTTAGAVMVGSAVFAIAHLPMYSGTPAAVGMALAQLFAISIVWGTVYARTHNLAVPMLCHGVSNALAVALLLL
ncbi:type II CAAX endopeptidase family protein [Haloarchaeobius sp. HME9146]|uniref:type II CAAX endopeptidase family protein n=1 Tax=Haloarchaeobius sp. HME9146 TaxID=2978732 RepID=UPI0021BFCDFF|nr:type II CAAX endopeptidase family protein [Haloarchaeobius sp. HME9146]MCT9094409.1 CPBP family intramembrane metalloprotease [Haloarchaeobius sp. HME9146]